MAYLPDDIWYMVCALLWHQRDFDTLFNCACSGKQLAAIAVVYLYRMQYITPVPEFAELSKKNKMPIRARWAGLWQSIILSSLDKTLYPYSHYIRTLDLQNLTELLTGDSSYDEISQNFFHGELRQFEKKASRKRLDSIKTISRIGEAITKRTPLLEEFIGTVSSGALTRFIRRLPRLTHLKLGWGEAIESNGAMIRLYCTSFKGLTICNWDGIDSDQGLAGFLNELRPHSLESFAHISGHDYGTECFQALNCHGESLKKLKLSMLNSGFFPKVWLLKGCTNLVSLSMAKTTSTHGPENSHNGDFLETLAWLRECKKLRTLSFLDFFRVSALMASILIENNIQLTSLRYEGSVTRDTKKFHQALASQTSLRSLCLREKYDLLVYPPKADVLIDSLSKLVNLTNLHLGQMSDHFYDRHIVQLANRLPKLEVWSTSGDRLTDAIWGEVATLRSLRRLDFTALVRFTAKGILDFIEKLGPGNNGLGLSVMNVERRSDISSVEGEKIQKIIAKKVKGKFELGFNEDLSFSSFESECGCEDGHWHHWYNWFEP